jgi:hypothetical protein
MNTPTTLQEDDDLVELLEQQVALLKKINDKLAFIVLVIILSMIALFVF